MRHMHNVIICELKLLHAIKLSQIIFNSIQNKSHSTHLRAVKETLLYFFTQQPKTQTLQPETIYKSKSELLKYFVVEINHFFYRYIATTVEMIFKKCR